MKNSILIGIIVVAGALITWNLINIFGKQKAERNNNNLKN